MHLHTTAILMIVISASALLAEESPKLPVPKEWRIEDTSYPPPWAKTLPWKGRLQLRFPPGFFKKNDDYFWSYPIFYWLEGDVLASEKDLERALRAYDAGLYGGQFAAADINIEIGEGKKRKGAVGVTDRSVTFHGFDPFVTKRPQTTYLRISRQYCAKSDRTAILILRSPRQFNEEDAVWKQLLAFRQHVDCP